MTFDTKSTTSVLVVDDNEANLLTIDVVLSDRDYNLIKVKSGREALAVVRQTEVAVVILDARMPDQDGFSVAAEIQKIPEAAHTPIVFLTARVDAEYRRRAFEAGAIDFLEKPINDFELRAKVKAFVRLDRSLRTPKGSPT